MMKTFDAQVTPLFEFFLLSFFSTLFLDEGIRDSEGKIWRFRENHTMFLFDLK
jgi:hypothetical protein